MLRSAPRNQRLILLEFNELCPELVEHGINDLAIFASEVEARRTIVNAAGASMPFHEYFLQMETVTTAKHHPDGIFWIMSGHPSRHAPKTGFAETLPLTHVRGKLEQALAFEV